MTRGRVLADRSPRPTVGRLLALDPGTVRVGVAVSDETRTIAQPHSTLVRHGERRLLEEVVELARKLEASEIVVGLPLRLDGSSGVEVERARQLGARLAAASGLPVSFADERLTSRQADRSLRDQGETTRTRRSVDHRVAAALLLQGVLAGAGRRA